MRWSTRSAGNLKTPISSEERMTSGGTLSRARPRKPFRSPARIQRGWVLARPGVGHPLVGDHLAGQPLYALGQACAPGETTAVVGDFTEIELDGRADALSEPQSG